MLHTKLDTPDNVATMVGNNTIFNGTIQNFSANPYRRVLLPVQLAGAQITGRPSPCWKIWARRSPT